MSDGPDESDDSAEEVNTQRKKKVGLTHDPGTQSPGLKYPGVPKKKQRKRKDLDVAGGLLGKNIPFVVSVVGVTTLSNRYKGEVTAFNKCRRC
jgi:hypothetical protein